MANWIISQFPKHKVYVEPFGGAASVLLRKERSYAEIYNDLDDDVVNLFRVARERGEELKNALELTPFSRGELVLSYEKSSDSLESARRLVMRSFMGFGSNSHNKASGFRSNSNRSGTTPAHDWRNYPYALGFVIERLRGVCIESRDATAVMAQHDSSDTLHYVDPPYVQSTRDKGVDYKHEMTDLEHEKLAETLHSLKGAVVLSGYRNPMYDSLYQDWVRVDKNSLADGARKRVESLWLSRQENCPGLFGAAA